MYTQHVQLRPGAGRYPAAPYPRRPSTARARRRARRRRQRRQAVLALAVCLVGAAVLWLLSLGLGGRAVGGPAVGWGAPASAQAPAAPAANAIAVAIDPGHGGSDGGAEGLGFHESEMTWATAQELLALLQADSRFAPFLTKAEDETCKPSQRAAAANAGGAQLVLSIHGNSDPVYGSSGFECYATPPGLANHDESLRFARLLAQQFAAAGVALRGEDGVRYCYYGSGDEKRIFESSDTTVRTEPTFTLLEDSACPAVLAEQCFITNQGDVAAFAGAAGCRAAAVLYYQAICAWFGVEPLAM